MRAWWVTGALLATCAVASPASAGSPLARLNRFAPAPGMDGLWQVEAVPMAQFQNFIRAQGGTLPGEGAAAAATTPAPAAPAATPSQQPESAIEGAPGAGAAPTTAPSVSPTA